MADAHHGVQLGDGLGRNGYVARARPPQRVAQIRRRPCHFFARHRSEPRAALEPISRHREEVVVAVAVAAAAGSWSSQSAASWKAYLNSALERHPSPSPSANLTRS